MAEEVKVIIGADTKQLTSELNKANESIKKFGSTVQTGANKASLALTDLSRIAQDAPYGFIGISNNINPLVESFGRLKAETGSTGSALKALVGELKGPAGLGLAFGLVSAAISFASIGLSRWIQKTEEAKAKTDEVKKGLESIYNSVAKEATEVTSLIAILKNENETRFRKLDAIKELQKISPEIFSNLKLEKDAVIGLDSSYKNYIESLKTVVASKIIQAKLEKELTKLIELQGITQTSIDKKNVLSSTFLLKERIKSLKQFGAEGQNQARLLQQEVDRIEGDLSGSTKLKIENTNKQIEELTNKLTELSTGLKTSGSSAKETEKALKKTGETIAEILAKFRRKLTAEEALGLPPLEELKAKINDYEAVIKKLITEKKVSVTSNIIVNLQAELGELQLKELYSRMFSRIKKELENEKIEAPVQELELNIPKTNIVNLLESERQSIISNIKKLKLSPLEIKEYFGLGGFENLNVDGLRKLWFNYLNVAKAEAEKFNKDIQQVFINATADSFIAIGESIGMAIAGQGDGIKAAFDGIFTIFAEALIQLGKYAILQSALIKQLKLAIQSGSFTGGVAAGIALIALGTVIKSTLSGINKKAGFAVGTSFAPGGMALVGERGPELVSLPQGSKVIPNGKTNSIMQGAMQSVEVYGTLRGQDIYFSNKKYGLTYNRQT